MWRETLDNLALGFSGTKISIHSLRVEGDSAAVLKVEDILEFQSTPSVWRETSDTPIMREDLVFQSTPSVWRETYC